MKSNRRIEVRITQEEHALVQLYAKQFGFHNVSAFVRYLVLQHAPTVIQKIDEIYTVIKKSSKC